MLPGVGLIIEAVRKKEPLRHYLLGDVGPVPFLHFMGTVEEQSEGYYSSKSTTYGQQNVMCRSTTGTGTSARLAFLEDEGKIKYAMVASAAMGLIEFFLHFLAFSNSLDAEIVINKTAVSIALSLIIAFSNWSALYLRK